MLASLAPLNTGRGAPGFVASTGRGRGKKKVFPKRSKPGVTKGCLLQDRGAHYPLDGTQKRPCATPRRDFF